ncbi:hypothetical protein TRFO_23425 [Tritrichomonas foetus]|uniref:Microbial-type PARG catalytic domain-containing protein n=1 Tax=Tritrichomonas foetus TaxID=1144522 RepID=A0A1J4K9L0_9EUKA|nr:hypothetical protein TRFO_23425 [Tritrichomonas foetus]|eukprot:OHT08145.1 hypothetical protein TRFO_23425 [Tritrichomonas foetus]
MFYQYSSLDEFPEIHPLSELPSLAEKMLEICEQGFYVNKQGQKISIKDQISNCIANTKTYTPDHLYFMPANRTEKGIIEISRETTSGCAYRLVVKEGLSNVAGLNYANAFHPGSGYLDQCRAQEETICRASCLVQSLEKDLTMYEYNQVHKTQLASDYIIYSPDVVFFRDDQYELLGRPFCFSIITSPAVNAKAYLRYENKDGHSIIHDVMDARIKKIILCAIENGVKNLILGPFGCGAFRNDTKDIASIFKKYLVDEGLRLYFNKVVFPVFEPVYQGDKLSTFTEVFSINNNIKKISLDYIVNP